MKIIWSSPASLKFEESINWYIENASIDISDNFIDYISSCTELIKNNPYMAKQVDEIEELREYVVRKYPYLISYYIENEVIIITSFLHQSQNK